MQKQRVYLNSCELTIDSITLNKNIEEQQVYFIWKKGKKFSKSNLYDLETKGTVAVREKLQLSLKLYTKNGKNETKNTHFYVMVVQSGQQTQRQLCSFVLGVHEWSPTGQKIKLQIKEEGKIIGSVNVQIRKKQVMELQNFQRYSAEIQESSDGDSTIVIMNSSGKAVQVELLQVQKQLEDFKFLNQKLRKDRAFLIARNQKIQKQLSTIRQTIQSEFTRMQQYYSKKLATHTSIYHQQIQQLITTFNENSNTNNLIMKSVITDNEGLYAELTELRQISEEELEKLNLHYKNKLALAAEEREKLEDEVDEQELRLGELEKELAALGKKYESSKEELDNLTLTFEIQKKQFKGKSENYEQHLETQRKQISDLKNQLAQKSDQLKQSNQHTQQLVEQLQNIKQSFQKLKIQRLKTQTELNDKRQLLQTMKIQREQNLQTIKRIQSQYEMYISESEKKGIEYQKELQELEIQSKEREIEFDKIINEERQKYFTENLKYTEANIKADDMEKLMIVRDEEIKTYIDENARLNQQLINENRKILDYEQQMKQLLEQAQHFKILNQTAEAKVNLITEQLQNSYKKNKEDLQQLRDHFEQSMRNRQKYYQQEIILLRGKLEQGQTSYLKLASDFRVQVEIYKEQIQKLQQEELKQMKEYGQVTTTNKKLELECAQYQALLKEAKEELKLRETRYEETLKMYMQNLENVNKFDRVSSIDRDIRRTQSLGSPKNEGNLEQKFSLTIPQLQKTDFMSQKQQKEYYKQLEGLGSIDHIKYLMSVQQLNRQSMAQLQRLQSENLNLQKLNIQFQKQSIKNNQELTALKQENQHLVEAIEELREELRYFVEKAEEEEKEKDERVSEHSGQLHVQIEHKQNEIDRNLSFRSEQQKSFQDKSIQDSRQKPNLERSRSRLSKALSIHSCRDQQVQVDLIGNDGGEDLNNQSAIDIKMTHRLSDAEQKELKKRQSLHDSAPLALGASPPRENKEMTLLQRQNSGLLRKIADFENQNQQKDEDLKAKQAKIQKLEQRNREIYEQLSTIKQQMGIKISMQESKLLQYSSMTKRQEEDVVKMKNTILQKQQQFRETQQEFSLRITKISYENEQLLNENKRLKKQYEELVEKSKKHTGNQYTRMVQQDIEDANKKIMELNRAGNQLKMEKQSAEDQVKIIKKKVIDLQRNLTSVTERKSVAEEEAETATRKFNKIKRDIDEKEQELNKVKQNYKKIQEEVANYNALTSQALVQRKRNLQQKLQLQQQVNKKDAEIRKITKQLQRHLQKVAQSNQHSKDRKNQSLKQLQRLQLQTTKQRKTIIQLQQKISYLSQKLQTVQQQNLKKNEQQKQQYRQKLNLLANDIVLVKNELDINNEERMHLLEEKQALREELEGCVDYIGKLEEIRGKLQREREEKVKDIGKMTDELDQNRQELAHYQEDSIDLHNRIANLEQQLNKQRLVSARKSQKVQQYQQLSQKYLYQLKTTKIVLSDTQSQLQTSTDLRSQLTQLQTRIQSLHEQLAQVTQQYGNYKSLYIYTREQVEELVNEIKESYEEIRRKQLADTIDELDQEYESKNLKREKEIIELYNENAKGKIEIQRKIDENAELMSRIVEMEQYPGKYRKLKEQYDGLVEEMERLRQDNTAYEAKYQKYELNAKEMQRIISDLKHEITLANSALTNQKSRSSRLQLDLQQAQASYSIAKQQLRKLSTQSTERIQTQRIIIQSHEQKILSIELQNARIKQREENMHKEYKEQIRKLEAKIKESMATMQQQSMTMQRDYKGKLAQKQRQLKQSQRNSQSLQSARRSVQHQLHGIRRENDELAGELSNTRLQMQEDEEIYIGEINKLKNNMKEMEDIYGYNVHALEEELAELNRQLMAERLRVRDNGLSNSRLRESEVERRMDEKLKNKDQKIEELRANVLVLEETVSNLKKKQDTDRQANENGPASKYQRLYNELTIQLQNYQRKYEQDLTQQQTIQKQLRRDLSRSKQNEQNLQLDYDQQLLTLQSLQCELKTLREVYETLQRELEKRQINLAENLSVKTIYDKELEYSKSSLTELHNIISQKDMEIKELKLKIRVKQAQLQAITQKYQQQSTNMQKILHKDQNTKKLTQLRQQQHTLVKQSLEQANKENRRLAGQIDLLRSQITRLRARETELEKAERKMGRQYAEAMQKLMESQEIVGKYMAVNEKSRDNHGVDVEELVLGGFLDEKFFDQEQQLNQLRQDIQEMRFGEDRRNLDLEQLKKQNLELTLKIEDYQFVHEQVETLRKICDKLQQQKKIAVFRQEAIRVRLTNLMSRNQGRQNIRDGLQAILSSNYHHNHNNSGSYGQGLSNSGNFNYDVYI